MKAKTKEVLITTMGITIFFVMPFLGGCITSVPPKENVSLTTETETEEPQEQEQKYIVKYATPSKYTDDGIIYVDTNGDEWHVIDPPEIDGDVRLLFDSKETKDVSDDTIIDITEIN